MAKENDVVLIYPEEKSNSFARGEANRPDVKKDRFQIMLLMLQIPLQAVILIQKGIMAGRQNRGVGMPGPWTLAPMAAIPAFITAATVMPALPLIRN